MGKVVKIALGVAAIVFTGGAAAYAAAISGASAATVGAIVSVTNALALSRALSGVSSLLAPKQRGNTIDSGIQVEFAGTVEPRRIVYGEALISGMNTIPPWCSGAKNDSLHQVLTLAGHEVNAITDVYLNQTLIESADIGAISGSISDGAVTTGAFANKVWIRRYAGTSTQTVDYILNAAFSGTWDSNHRGRGVAYVALQYKYDTEVYRNGKPEVRVVVQGKKVYDPRLDSTNGGSGSHRVDTPSTWAYSSNPALCLADYIRDDSLGLGESTARIDWALVAAAASVCDENVTIPPASPTTTQKRYTLNQCVLDCTAPYEDNIQALAGAMLGYCVYSGGKWRIYAGKAQSSAFTIGDDDVVGSVEFRTAVPYRERWNAIRGQYIDAARLSQPTEYPVVRVSADETADGEGPVWKEVHFPFCTDPYEAQRNAIILQRLSRRKKRWVVTCAWTAYKIRPGEWGTLNLTELGVSGQLVKCTEWTWEPSGTVRVILDEAATADWNDPIVANYATPGSPSVPNATSMIPDLVTGITTQGGQDGLTIYWSPPTNAVPGTTYQVYEHTSSTPFSSATAIGPRTAQASVFLPKTDATTRYYWVVAFFPNGEDSSDEIGSSAGVPGAALAAAAGFRITVSPGVCSAYGLGSSQTTNTTTVTPINPAGSVTYSWAYVSGDTSITCTASTSATTAFQRTGMAVDTAYTAVWRVTANDGVDSETFDVTVNFYRNSFN